MHAGKNLEKKSQKPIDNFRGGWYDTYMNTTTMSETKTRMTPQMRAKVNTVCAAHYEWQRGAINKREYLRRADITDAQHADIEQYLPRTASPDSVLLRVANVLYPVAR